MADRLLPRQLLSQGVVDVPSVCERIRGALMLLGDDGTTEIPDRVFQRPGS